MRVFRRTRYTVCTFLSVSILILIVTEFRKESQRPNINVIRWQPDSDSDIEYDSVKGKCINGKKGVNAKKGKEYTFSDKQTSLLDRITYESNMTDRVLAYMTLDNLHEVVKRIRSQSKSVLFSVINNGYIPFLYSWLCNTKHMNIHSLVLVVTTDIQTADILRRDWPKIHAVALDLDIPSGNQGFSRVGYLKIMVKRTELLLLIIKTGINVMLTEFDYVWFGNALQALEEMTGADILVNPITSSTLTYNGGLIYIFANTRSVKLWEKLVDMMRKLESKLQTMSNDARISDEENDQVYFSRLVGNRYAGVHIRELPLKTYADGVWYMMSESQRRETNPVMISNSFIEGNGNKMKRAIQWGHWFLKDDCICDIEVVRTLLEKKPSSK